MALPVLDFAVAQLFTASRLSQDASTAAYKLRRIVPISIFVDGESDDETAQGDWIKDQVNSILSDIGAGFDVVGEWGPFYGSYFTTLFAQSREEELGRSFDERVLDVVRGVGHLTTKVPKGVRVVLLVGAFVVSAGVVPEALVAIGALHHIALTVEGAEVVHAVSEILPPP
jgi:hypothetical protein